VIFLFDKSLEDLLVVQDYIHHVKHQPLAVMEHSGFEIKAEIKFEKPLRALHWSCG